MRPALGHLAALCFGAGLLLGLACDEGKYESAVPPERSGYQAKALLEVLVSPEYDEASQKEILGTRKMRLQQLIDSVPVLKAAAADLGDTSLGQSSPDARALREALREMSRVEMVPHAAYIYVIAEGDEPDLLPIVANALSEALVEHVTWPAPTNAAEDPDARDRQELLAQRRAIQQKRDRLQEQLGGLSGEAFRAPTNPTVKSQLAVVENRRGVLATAEQEATEAENELQQAQELSDAEVAQLPEVREAVENDAAVEVLRENIKQQRLELQVLLGKHDADHPEVEQTHRMIAALEKQLAKKRVEALAEAVDDYRRQVEKRAAAARERLEEAQQALRQAEEKLASFRSDEGERLSREIKKYDEQIAEIDRKLEAAPDVGSGKAVRIVQRATEATAVDAR